MVIFCATFATNGLGDDWRFTVLFNSIPVIIVDERVITEGFSAWSMVEDSDGVSSAARLEPSNLLFEVGALARFSREMQAVNVHCPHRND